MNGPFPLRHQMAEIFSLFYPQSMGRLYHKHCNATYGSWSSVDLSAFLCFWNSCPQDSSGWFLRPVVVTIVRVGSSGNNCPLHSFCKSYIPVFFCYIEEPIEPSVLRSKCIWRVCEVCGASSNRASSLSVARGFLPSAPY